MGASFDQLTDEHKAFIARQKMFFVATAPLAGDGSVNLSPKGYDSLAVHDEKKVSWIDLGGSGVETIAHLQENGRITLMFCAFEGAANILRVYGRGRAVCFDDAGFDEMMRRFPSFDRARAVIDIDIHRVTESCGWGVPFYEFKEEREQLRRWHGHRSLDDWKAHRYEANSASIDGLPGLTPPGASSTNKPEKQ